jgi:hypothetical protein
MRSNMRWRSARSNSSQSRHRGQQWRQHVPVICLASSSHDPLDEAFHTLFIAQVPTFASPLA